MCCICARCRSTFLSTHSQECVLVQQQAASVVTCDFDFQTGLISLLHHTRPPGSNPNPTSKRPCTVLFFLWQSTCSVCFQQCMSRCTPEHHQQPLCMPTQRNATASTPCDCSQYDDCTQCCCQQGFQRQNS